jgi:hypothetical protein
MSKRLAKGSSKVCFYRDKRVASIHAAEQIVGREPRERVSQLDSSGGA